MRGTVLPRAAGVGVVFLAAFIAATEAISPPATPRTLRMIVVLDPACPEAVSIFERLGEFRRLRPEVPVRLLVPDPNAFGRAGQEILAALERHALELEWDPTALGALGLTRTPAVVVLDPSGWGVHAAGVPDLVAVLRAAEGR